MCPYSLLQILCVQGRTGPQFMFAEWKVLVQFMSHSRPLNIAAVPS